MYEHEKQTFICLLADSITHQTYEVRVQALDDETASEVLNEMGLTHHDDDSLLGVRQETKGAK
jgi:hypothetical protein